MIVIYIDICLWYIVYICMVYGIHGFFFVKNFLVHLFWIQPSRHLDVFGGLNRLRKIRGKAPPWLSFLPRVFVRKKKEILPSSESNMAMEIHLFPTGNEHGLKMVDFPVPAMLVYRSITTIECFVNQNLWTFDDYTYSLVNDAISKHGL